MKKDNKVFMFGRSKLQSIESKTSEALIHNEISHDDFKSLNAIKFLITVENIWCKAMRSYCLNCKKQYIKYKFSNFRN